MKKNGDNKYLIAILYEKILILTVKTMLLV